MRSGVRDVLARALRQRCPACGGAPIFERRFVLVRECPSCGLEIRSREPNTWFFMYVSTAAITGVFLLLYLFALPRGWRLARVLTFAAAAASFLGTMPLRKSLAIALDYLF
jgi:uncharacterized protein (DUF983 family)